MHNKTLKVFFSVSISFVVVACIVTYFYNLNFNQKNRKVLLGMANQIIDEKIVNLDSYNNSKDKMNEEQSTSVNNSGDTSISANNLEDKTNEDKLISANNSKDKINEEQSTSANNLEDTKNKEEQSVIYKNNNILGKIKIKEIGVEAPVLDGTTPDVLKISVGHFKSTSYWNGNVALASHNRGSYAHYFEKINKLKVGDEIIYQTKYGTRIYSVDKIEQISQENLSVLESTKENTITLITCVKGNKNARLCVKGTEKIL